MRAYLIVGRILFGGAVVAAGARYGWHAETWGDAGLAQASALAHGVSLAGAVVLALAGASVMLGVLPRIGLASMAGALALVTPLLHAFWSAPDAAAQDMQLSLFLQNIGLMGAAVALMALPEPWPGSIDSFFRSRPGGGQPPWLGAPAHTSRWLQQLLAAVRHASARLHDAVSVLRARTPVTLARREPERAEYAAQLYEATPQTLSWHATILDCRYGSAFRVRRGVCVVSETQAGDSYITFRGAQAYRVPLADSYG